MAAGKPSSVYGKALLVSATLRDLECPHSVVVRRGLSRLRTVELAELRWSIWFLTRDVYQKPHSLQWGNPLVDSLMTRLRSQSLMLATGLKQLANDELQFLLDRVQVLTHRIECTKWAERWAK